MQRGRSLHFTQSVGCDWKALSRGITGPDSWKIACWLLRGEEAVLLLFLLQVVRQRWELGNQRGSADS